MNIVASEDNNPHWKVLQKCLINPLCIPKLVERTQACEECHNIIDENLTGASMFIIH